MDFESLLQEKTTGEKIKTARKAKGLTQAELAHKIGVTQPTVAQWERGGYMPQYSNLQAISQVTGVALFFLCDSKTWEAISAKATLANELNSDTVEKERIKASALLYWAQKENAENAEEELYTWIQEYPKVFEAFLKLNEEGRKALNQYAEDLTYNPRYTNKEEV